MAKIRSLLDRSTVLALGLTLFVLALAPDLIGIGSPGFGVKQITLLLTGLGLLFASLVLKIRSTKVGPEILLLSLSVLFTTVAADLLLGFLLPPTYVANKYGWTPPANTLNHHTVEDMPGQFREVQVRFFQNGFKRWGNPNTDKRKLFVIGDSFAEMTWVPNGEEWYSHLETQLRNIELFVYGAGGYGSLQEYLVLDDYIDKVRPDVILWQFCSNDYEENNLYELDLLNYPYNSHAVRPYLEEERIVYRLPLPYAKLRGYSFIADRLLKAYDRLMWRRATRDLNAYYVIRAHLTEDEVARRKLLHEKSYYVTLEIMKKVKERAKETPIYLFNACNSLTEVEEKICSATGIICLRGIGEYVAEKTREGLTVKVPNDGHWNKLGNQVVGERLVRYFRELDIVKDQLASFRKMDGGQ